MQLPLHPRFLILHSRLRRRMFLLDSIPLAILRIQFQLNFSHPLVQPLIFLSLLLHSALGLRFKILPFNRRLVLRFIPRIQLSLTTNRAQLILSFHPHYRFNLSRSLIRSLNILLLFNLSQLFRILVQLQIPRSVHQIHFLSHRNNSIHCSSHNLHQLIQLEFLQSPRPINLIVSIIPLMRQ